MGRFLEAQKIKRKTQAQISPAPKRNLAAPEELENIEKEEREKIEAVKTELKEVIEQTRQINVQAVEDRAKVEQILSRARIHEQILRSMRPVEPIRVANQVDVGRILKREKVRLISERTRQAQSALRSMERSASGTSPAKDKEAAS